MAAPETNTPAMTVVVMGYRNQATIAEAVGSLLNGDDPDVEVVVVTSGGDRSGEVVRRWFPGVTVIDSAKRLMPGGARNAGVEASHGSVVAFLAADCVAEPGWAAARLAAHRGGHPVVAGAMTSVPPHRPWAWASHLVLFRHRLPGRPAGPVPASDPAAHGLSFDRSVLDVIGPFDSELRIGEDTDAAHRVERAGFPIWFEPKVRTAHRGPVTTAAMLADHRRRGNQAALHRRQRAGARVRRRTAARRAAAATVVALTETASTLAAGWRYSHGERWRLALSVPWIVAAVTAKVSAQFGPE